MFNQHSCRRKRRHNYNITPSTVESTDQHTLFTPTLSCQESFAFVGSATPAASW